MTAEESTTVDETSPTVTTELLASASTTAGSAADGSVATAAPTASVSPDADDSYLASLFPVMTEDDVAALATNGGQEPEQQLVQTYVEQLVPNSAVSTEATETNAWPHKWSATAGALELLVLVDSFGEQPDGTPIVGVSYVYGPAVDFPLSVSVKEGTQGWEAWFGFEADGSTTVSYSSSDWTVENTTTMGEITLHLPSEPINQPRVVITARDESGSITDVRALLIPPGPFAAS